jgi:uncharacterized surface protein with fasciclin (FAS1) repeats
MYIEKIIFNLNHNDLIQITYFSALSRDQNRKLQTDSQYVKSTFRYHVLPAAVTTSDMNDGEMLDTLTQDPVRLSIFQQVWGSGDRGWV